MSALQTKPAQASITGLKRAQTSGPKQSALYSHCDFFLKISNSNVFACGQRAYDSYFRNTNSSRKKDPCLEVIREMKLVNVNASEKNLADWGPFCRYMRKESIG